MSMSDASMITRAPSQEAGFGDYFALLKPRVMSLVVFTAMVGLFAAPISVHPIVAFCVDSVHCYRWWRIWGVKHVVGCRHRRDYAPDAVAANPFR